MNQTTANTPWNQTEKNNWFAEQTYKRSYTFDVVPKIVELETDFDVRRYGVLSLNPSRYPLFIITSKLFDVRKKTVLITGGVHGYETSGIYGALSFMKNEAKNYTAEFNFICAPCLSPWSYETINRWNHKAIDPNRSFIFNSPADECELFLKAVSSFLDEIYVHFDLHETTETDNSVFRPALASRDGKVLEKEDPIPDGFYLVGDTENPCADFQKAIIEAVKKITHIAPANQQGKIIGEEIEQEGVINYPLKKLSLCAGISNAKYTTTTEVYPDSPKVSNSICIQAQVAAIKGGLDFIKVMSQSK